MSLFSCAVVRELSCPSLRERGLGQLTSPLSQTGGDNWGTTGDNSNSTHMDRGQQRGQHYWKTSPFNGYLKKQLSQCPGTTEKGPETSRSKLTFSQWLCLPWGSLDLLTAYQTARVIFSGGITLPAALCATPVPLNRGYAWGKVQPSTSNFSNLRQGRINHA
jgi:hypothetical protein